MASPPPQPMKAIVKSALSGDSIVLKGRPQGPTGLLPGKERILHLAGISAPRLGSTQREDDEFAFPAREFLRAMLVGREVSFSVLHSQAPQKGSSANGGETSDVPREYGVATILPPGATAPVDLATLIVSSGWAKVRELSASSVANESSVETARKDALRAAEAEAKAEGRGLWNGSEVQRTVNFHMADAQAFLQTHKGQPLNAIVESVRDGSTLRIRLVLSDTHHQFVTLSLAGVKAPRTDTSEPFALESKHFTESRLLQRPLTVVLLSSPASIGLSPLSSSPSPSPPPPATGGFLPAPAQQGTSLFIGTAMHPQMGDLTPHLVGVGLARVLAHHAGLLASSSGSMDRLRAAEKAARDKRACIWETLPAPVASTAAGASSAAGASEGAKGLDKREEALKSFEGEVIRVWGADQISVRDKATGEERRVQFSSLRGPRPSDPKQAFWANEAKEFLRKKLIGKTVQVQVDYVKPREGEFDERTCVTVRFGGANANVAEALIEKGLASVLRHRRDDENRSPEMDALIEAEQKALAELKGMHSGKEPVLPRIIDASETGAKAAQFLPGFKRAGRQPAVVDFVAAGSRFKVLLHKDDKKLTFVLAGIRAPRTARNPGEKGEPFGVESARFAARYMQRDVEIDFESVDKTGGFIGSMYVNRTENVAVELVRAGLATVHAFSAEGLASGKMLVAAEEEAKKAKRGVWHAFDPKVEEAEAAMAAAALAPPKALPTSYVDVVVSCVRPTSFSVQILSPSNSHGAALERLMSDFTLFHKSSSAKSPAGFAPKAGDLISAQFSEDDRWYRARVKRASQLKKECEVVFVDYGNEETVPFTRARPCETKFKALPDQAHDARLAFVKLLKAGSEYGAESMDRFRDMAEGRKLIANVDYKDPAALHLRLMDPTDPRTGRDPTASLNADLLREGLAAVDRSCRYTTAYPAIARALEDAITMAKRERLGAYEYGDIAEDDE